MKLRARRLNSKYWSRKSTPWETLFPLLLCVTSITLEKPPSRPFSPLIPSSAPPSRAPQQPRERHVRLSEQQAPEKINLPRFMVSSAKPQLEAFSLSFLLSLTLLPSLSMHPSFFLHLSLSGSLRLIPFITPLLSAHSPHHRFGNVTVRQHYSDVIVLITILGRQRDRPLTWVASVLAWPSVQSNLSCLV